MPGMGRGWGVNEAEQRNEGFREGPFTFAQLLYKFHHALTQEPCSGPLPQESLFRSPVLGSVKQNRGDGETERITWGHFRQYLLLTTNLETSLQPSTFSGQAPWTTSKGNAWVMGDTHDNISENIYIKSSL